MKSASDMECIPLKMRTNVFTKYVVVVVLLLGSSFILISQISNYSQFLTEDGESDCSPLPVRSRALDPGRALVNSIKEATRVASGKIDDPSTPDFSPEEQDHWNARHPCQSRGPDGLLSFYNRRKYTAENVPVNPLWDEVFEAYTKLHRVCMQKAGDISTYFHQKNVSSGCKFLVADTADKTEFGNKILVLASSLLFAILTQRVILIPESTLIPSCLCEPFAGSSWLLDTGGFPLPPTSFRRQWKLEEDIFTGIDWHQRRCSSSDSSSLSVPRAPYAAGVRTNQQQPQQRFYCTLEQAVYSETSFVYLSGFVYTIPKMFSSPSFRPALEALFPDRIVITRLLRSAFLPANPVWKRVRGLDQGYLQPAHRRVGIQLQYNGRGFPGYKDMNGIVEKRIAACLIDNDILPNISDPWEARSLPSPSPTTPVIQVVIASLFLGLKDHLSRMYGRNPTVTGDLIGVVQVSQNVPRELSADAHVEKFKEALLLSFSDQLLVTPTSTLGSVAQAYGALVPWFIEVRKNGWMQTYGACERGQTIEPCNPFAEKIYSCSKDSSVDGNLLVDAVPYIQNCLTIDHCKGIQLMTS